MKATRIFDDCPSCIVLKIVNPKRERCPRLLVIVCFVIRIMCTYVAGSYPLCLVPTSVPSSKLFIFTLNSKIKCCDINKCLQSLPSDVERMSNDNDKGNTFLIMKNCKHQSSAWDWKYENWDLRQQWTSPVITISFPIQMTNFHPYRLNCTMLKRKINWRSGSETVDFLITWDWKGERFSVLMVLGWHYLELEGEEAWENLASSISALWERSLIK